MNIFFSDEYNKLTDDIKLLMNKAANTAIFNEFGKVLNDIDTETLPIEVSVTIVGNEEIQSINNEFRGIDKVTDVLSFPQYDSNADVLADLEDVARNIEDEDLMGTLLGDVVICYEQAIKQAEEYETGMKRELVYLFTHSIFHLLGYDHMNDEDKKVMRAKEEVVMEALGL